MKYTLVDTNIWSAFFRRKNDEDATLKKIMFELVESGSIKIIGPIRQEILSGIRSKEKFELLRQAIECFEDTIISTRDYENAARFRNSCSAAGIAASSIDCIIVSIATSRGWRIFTRDRDFLRYKEITHFELLEE